GILQAYIIYKSNGSNREIMAAIFSHTLAGAIGGSIAYINPLLAAATAGAAQSILSDMMNGKEINIGKMLASWMIGFASAGATGLIAKQLGYFALGLAFATGDEAMIDLALELAGGIVGSQY